MADGFGPALTVPSNLEAEQSLLGAVLFDNEAFHRIEGLEPHHFAEPVHGEIWRVVADMIGKGRLADPIVLHDRLKVHGAYEELGAVRYLAQMIDTAPPAVRAADYAKVVVDCWTSRRLIDVAAELDADARSGEMTGPEKIEAAEQKLYGLAESREHNSGLVSFGTSLAEAVASAADAYQRDGKLSGLSTGLMDVDRKLGGLHPSDLIIVAARPSMGKSALVANIAYSIAKHYAWQPEPDGSRKTIAGGVVALFSLEMSRAQVATRILAEVSGVPSDKIRKGEITAIDFHRIRDAATEIASAPLEIDDTGALALAKIRTRARRLKRTTGLDCIVVDYLQLVTAPTRKGEGRVQEVSEITQGLKALAKELNVPVIAAAQLSRQVESRDDKRPMLSDLRESGSIEQDADVVMFIYREEYYRGRSEPKAGTKEHDDWLQAMDECRGVAEIIIGKQRHGPIGTVRLHFNETLTKFSDLARDGHVGGRLPYGSNS